MLVEDNVNKRALPVEGGELSARYRILIQLHTRIIEELVNGVNAEGDIASVSIANISVKGVMDDRADYTALSSIDYSY
jgi:hypothetical protein